jgi:hypothetical protein
MGQIWKRQSLTGPNYNGVANFGKIADTEYDSYRGHRERLGQPAERPV